MASFPGNLPFFSCSLLSCNPVERECLLCLCRTNCRCLRDKQILDTVQAVQFCVVVQQVTAVLRIVEAGKTRPKPNQQVGGVDPKFSTRSGSEGEMR